MTTTRQTAPLPAEELDRIAAAIARPALGYPALHDRLFLDTPGLHVADSVLHVPDGPWHVTGHPNRVGAPAALLDPEEPGGHADPALTAQWRAAGLTVDQYGHLAHPDWRSLLGDPRIGLPTGLGFFWRRRSNATADAYVERPGRRGPEVLLIQRLRGRKWALPGGFIDRADGSAEAAALRELAEETRLRIPGVRTETVLTRRPVRPSATLHAWTGNTVVRVEGDPAYLAEAMPVAGDDAIDAAWVTVREALALDLFDVHAEYIAALAEVAR